MFKKLGKYATAGYFIFIVFGILLLLVAVAGIFINLSDSDKKESRSGTESEIGFEDSGYMRTDRIGDLYHWPCPGYTTVTSKFGLRMRGFHHGVDYGFGTDTGKPLVAVDDGVVTFTGYHDMYGNYLIIKLSREPGYEVLYAHVKCEGFRVNKGDNVEYGQVIALSGGADKCKGTSTGPHLHFEVRQNGKAINPRAITDNCESKSKNNILKPIRGKDVEAITGTIVWQEDYLLKTDLRTKSEITERELERAFSRNTFVNGYKNGLVGTAKYFLKAEKEYGVNAVFLASIAVLESSWGTSNYARNRNNLFGMNANTGSPDDAYSYASKEECIMHVAKSIKGSYLTKSGVYFEGYNLPAVRIHYCPPEESHWDLKVAEVMQQLWETRDNK